MSIAPRRSVSATTEFAARTSVGFAGTFFPLAVQLAFLPVWLAHAGFDAASVGLVLGTALVVRIVAVPPLVALSDRFSSRRLAFISYAGIALVLSSGLFGTSQTLMALAVIVISVAAAAIIPIVDAVALGGVRRLEVRYGRMRLWGSVAFVAGTILSGWIIRSAGIGAVPFLVAVSLAASFVCGMMLPTIQTQRPHGNEDWRHLLRDRVLLSGIVCGSLVVSSHATFYAFGSIHWTALTFDPTLIAWLWVVGVLAEIVLFAIVGKRYAPSSRSLLIVGAAAGIVRWGTFTLDGGPYFYILNSVLHAGTFGAAYLGMQQLIAERVSITVHGSAQGLTQLIAGPATALLTVASGWLYASFGGEAFLIAAATCGFALAIILYPQRAGSGGDTIDPE